jgi:UDP-3-O-[3-hydroxymyristoyl] N-acetylglucosamine deacetylase
MSEILFKENKLLVNGNGLFSKEEVNVSIQKAKPGSGITFVLGNEKINANVKNVSNATRNTVLSTSGGETICLIEHFLAACSLLNVDDIEVHTNKNELVMGDGSAIHWFEAFKKASLIKDEKIIQTHNIKETILIKKDKKEIVAIPHNGFKVSYAMDHPHPALGKMWASFEATEDPMKILRARTFGTKQENDFFGVTDKLLTLLDGEFNKELHEPIEPAYHKVLDIIGDLRLCGINPLKINMHVIGFRSGHEMNVDLCRSLIVNCGL